MLPRNTTPADTMTPTRPKLASRSSSRASSQYVDTEEHFQQSGRAPVNIAAQASAQSLREASRPSSRGPSRSSSQPNLLRKKNKNAQPISEEGDSEVSGEGLMMPARRLHEVRTASPLHQHPSNSSDDPSDVRKHSAEGPPSTSSSHDSAGRSHAATAAGAALAAQLGTQTPIKRHSLLRDEMSPNDSTLSLTRQTTPRTVRDLGSDYTRYFNPFASRNNSQQDLSNTLPRYNSSTHLMTGAGALSSTDLSKRLSNPFQDSKRMSNPFASRPHTAPGTPMIQITPAPKQIGEVSEKEAGAAAVGMPIMTPTQTPVRTGTPVFIREADPEKAGFFPYMDDRLGAPEYAFPLYSDEKEDDDDLHMPQWDDDKRLKPHWKDHFTRENILSTFGLAFMILGLLLIFVILPVVSYTTKGLLDYNYETPLSQMPKTGQAEPWAIVNDRDYPLMSNVRTGLIDPDTPSAAKTRVGVNGDTYKLVFSDEFNEKNRSFWPGDDPYWFGGNFWYGATQDLEWYDPDAINTGDGTLQIQLDEFQNHGLNYRSGMLNSWNQLCFKGGIYEVSMSLPGPAGVHGLWPGAWSMGNLGRPGHLATTDGMWPYTYNECDVGITPNQSMTDGTSFLPGQRLPSCSCTGEDHPTPGTGRGAPEIDIAEISGDWSGKGWAVATQSYQVAPFDIWYYPNYEFMELPNYNVSYVNTYTGGPFQEAVSTTTVLNNAWYDGVEYQKYAYEYVPGSGKNSYVAWTVGDNDEMMKFDARATGPNGNIGQRPVSEEPMSMVINLGFSNSWVNIDWPNLKFPTVMRVDYVRWYQKEGEEMVTCDPPGYETTQYIRDHPEPYNNPNLTHWADAGYSRPKNSLMDGCKAASSSSSNDKK
ncbi:beta-glucan synthesis-associated protein [Recurvomyces mirabilis]|uniref:Beta-glucan synthesis-associated protein n=1 Tax=Recurvomyces mirabilis TaxID=574656 RepID=A0AAE0TUQ1_9PEZI|nr:beta-glucan synthesis-associated protein [Recurvomyces mirabilis]KAK5156307.1 beta-glucan synthesis-associated protein [Recurvomyces mirabilis]